VITQLQLINIIIIIKVQLYLYLPLGTFMLCSRVNFTYNESDKFYVIKNISAMHNTVLYPTIRQTFTIGTVKFKSTAGSILS